MWPAFQDVNQSYHVVCIQLSFYMSGRVLTLAMKDWPVCLLITDETVVCVNTGNRRTQSRRAMKTHHQHLCCDMMILTVHMLCV